MLLAAGFAFYGGFRHGHHVLLAVGLGVAALALAIWLLTRKN